MKLQFHCDNCGAVVFQGQHECRYCHALIGYAIERSDKRSALPTTPVPYPKMKWGWYQSRRFRAECQQALQANNDRFYAEGRIRMSPNLGRITQQEVMNALWKKYMPAVDPPGYVPPVYTYQQWWDWNRSNGRPELVWRWKISAWLGKNAVGGAGSDASPVCISSV
jgi:hypothetical protein